MTPTRPDSEDYQRKKRLYDQLLTIYGRKPVLEALQQPGILVHRLHLADSNRPAALLDEISTLARAKGAEICLHSKQALSRISRNGKQDQGVAVDLVLAGYQPHEVFLANMPAEFELIALDGITNPQNLGMIVRSALAGQIDGIVYSRRGNAALGPLVVKASAGTLYRAPLLMCAGLPQALQQCAARGMEICTLAAQARQTLFEHRPAGHCIYVLGNESEGVSEAVSRGADTALSIPMAKGVESLNVAVTAGLIAYAPALARYYRER